MTSVTVQMDGELAAGFLQRARAIGASPRELVQRMLDVFLGQTPAVRRLELIGLASSQEMQSDPVDELLAQGFGS